MKQTEKLASSIHLIKSSNARAAIMRLLKGTGLVAAGAGAGAIAGSHSGYHSGYNQGLSEGSATNQEDLMRGLSMLMQQLAQKGRESK